MIEYAIPALRLLLALIAHGLLIVALVVTMDLIFRVIEVWAKEIGL